MRRVVVTGLGIVSCIGNNKSEVLESLKAGTSGIEYCEKYAELGFRSHVHGAVKIDVDALVRGAYVVSVQPIADDVYEVRLAMNVPLDDEQLEKLCDEVREY